MPAAVDQLGRTLRDLRISVTDRCNFRCTYCMPKELFGHDFAFLPKSQILSFEEIEGLTRVFVGLGVRKLRLTGGEPLLRHEIEHLVEMLSHIPGVEDLALTTNGALLGKKAAVLKKAGLKRVTVSLDALDQATFGAMNGVGYSVEAVVRGIEAARAEGFAPVKINVVVKRGVNEHAILQLLERFRGPDFILRFIEYMDVGNSNGWSTADVVPAAEIIEVISRHSPIEPIPTPKEGAVAARWRFTDGTGEVGIISSVSNPFCGGCTRARLSSEGKLYTCLFAANGLDLKTPLRSGASEEELTALVRGIWQKREDRYSELRSEATRDLKRVEMSRIGG